MAFLLYFATRVCITIPLIAFQLDTLCIPHHGRGSGLQDLHKPHLFLHATWTVHQNTIETVLTAGHRKTNRGRACDIIGRQFLHTSACFCICAARGLFYELASRYGACI